MNENLKDPKEVNGVAKALHRVFCAHGDVAHAHMVVEMVQSSKNPNIQGIFESKNKWPENIPEKSVIALTSQVLISP